MERALLNSEEEYFDLCVKEKIGIISREHERTRYAEIGGGVDCEFSTTYESFPFRYLEKLQIVTKPEQYPCLLVWDYRDGAIGEIIYEKDFQLWTK